MYSIGIDPHTITRTTPTPKFGVGVNRQSQSSFGVGVDIGATEIKFVLLKNLKVLKTQKIFTPKNKEKLIKVLKENMNNLIFGIPQSKIKGIGIGVPGPLSKKRDFILNPPNLKCLSNCPLTEIIEKDLNIKARMENDVSCFVLAETILGSAKGAEIVAGITLGTGVGGGIIWKGKLIKGAFGSAGEFGYITINSNAEYSGFFEDYCSEKFFKRKGIYSKDLEKKAKKGNKQALKIFQEYGKYLGIGISNVINILDPEVIIIGGGIAKANRFFMKSAKKEIQKRVLSPLSKKFVKIKISKLKDFSGAIGAALLLEDG